MPCDASNAAPSPLVLADFQYPAALILLPLAGLPWIVRRRDTLSYPAVGWLPPDRLGPLMLLAGRLLAALTLAGLIVGLASPGRSGGQQLRSGRGAEVLLLMDRSSSMDNFIASNGTMAEANSASGTKNNMARSLLTQFVTRRPNERFALTTFGTGVMSVAPFSDHNDAVLAGLEATRIGRGLPHTDLGAALLAAVDAFRTRTYSGSRVILLVSDGGAELDPLTRTRLQAGLQRNRISLYYIFIRSAMNSPDLNAAVAADADVSEELALHRFFLSLPTPYHLYQAADSSAIADALADIDKQQNAPLTYLERVPRVDRSRLFFAAAAVTCALLLVFSALRLRALQ